jgi:hypothetical protein
MSDWQDEGEPLRQALGIDGTAGDAQDVMHGFVKSKLGEYCAVCGLAQSYRKHCTCPHEHRPLGRLYGISMGKGWVRLRDDPDCPQHGRRGRA